MISIHVSFGVIILYSVVTFTLAKPFDEDKSFSHDTKLNCMDSNQRLGYERTNPNSYYDYYKPRSRFEGSEKFSNKPFEFDRRSAASEFDDNLANGALQKRQVGVVYKDDRPIGILQPYQRSYRFIPVKEEDNSYEINSDLQETPFKLPAADIDKREVGLNPAQLDEIYPSILTNFKIVNKLDKKRNYDALTDENVQDLKATIRRLRSSNSRNNEQIEEELKNILDDMGLIEDEEIHGNKREVTEEQGDDDNEALTDDEIRTDKERSKRDEPCNSETDNKVISEQNVLSNDGKRMEVRNDDYGHTSLNKREDEDESKDSHRKKRQKQETTNENSDLVENLKDSGDLMVSGNKSPLASSSNIVERDAESKESEKSAHDEEGEDYEKRVERQIQSKINSLKEEVKREIEALKKRQNDDDDEDTQRKKRQVFDNLINEETDELNPAMNPDEELKPLVRKRRGAKGNGTETSVSAVKIRKKRETTGRKKRKSSSDSHEKNYRVHHEDNDDGGGLLGGDDFDDGVVSKREIYDTDENYGNENSKANRVLYKRGKRSGLSDDLGLYNKYFYNNFYYNNGRLKRQNNRERDSFGTKLLRKRFIPSGSDQWRSRFRRRINENQVVNRPQQLSDMSDLDLFGALPKSYDGELSRYKRVKRK